jgi:hypothetical protein
VTHAEIDQALASYGAGLEAELSLLQRLQDVAITQRDVTAGRAPGRLEGVVEARDRIMTGLLEIESQLRPLRALIAAHRHLAATRPAFAETSAFHRTAAALVHDILGADRDTLAALRATEAARRQAARALETGGNTLAAYRRVIAPFPSQAALIDEQG